MTIGNCRRNQSPGAVSCRHRKMKVEKGFLTGRGKAWFRRHTLAHPIETDGENESTGAVWRRKQVKQRKTRDEDPGRPRPDTMSGDANGSRAPDAKHGQEKKRNQPVRWRVKTHERQNGSQTELAQTAKNQPLMLTLQLPSQAETEENGEKHTIESGEDRSENGPDRGLRRNWKQKLYNTHAQPRSRADSPDPKRELDKRGVRPKNKTKKNSLYNLNKIHYNHGGHRHTSLPHLIIKLKI
jgi:hypothetical protein